MRAVRLTTAPDVTEREVALLARAMTYKDAVPDVMAAMVDGVAFEDPVTGYRSFPPPRRQPCSPRRSASS